jgi:hypothetical protein
MPETTTPAPAVQAAPPPAPPKPVVSAPAPLVDEGRPAPPKPTAEEIAAKKAEEAAAAELEAKRKAAAVVQSKVDAAKAALAVAEAELADAKKAMLAAAMKSTTPDALAAEEVARGPFTAEQWTHLTMWVRHEMHLATYGYGVHYRRLHNA